MVFLDKLNDLQDKQSMDRKNINTIPSFHYSIIPVAKGLLPSQISDQCTYLCGQVGNHDDQNHQQKCVRVDDP